MGGQGEGGASEKTLCDLITVGKTISLGEKQRVDIGQQKNNADAESFFFFNTKKNLKSVRGVWPRRRRADVQSIRIGAACRARLTIECRDETE